MRRFSGLINRKQLMQHCCEASLDKAAIVLHLILLIVMYLTSEKKAELFAKYGNDAKNTGSAESQIALFTFRINHLTEHLKANRKDFGTERALTALVGKRRSMLDYLKRKDIERYRAIIKELGIRK